MQIYMRFPSNSNQPSLRMPRSHIPEWHGNKMVTGELTFHDDCALQNVDIPKHSKAPAAQWAATRLHKQPFGIYFALVADHEALKFIHDSHATLAKSFVAMVQRWDVILGTYS